MYVRTNLQPKNAIFDYMIIKGEKVTYFFCLLYFTLIKSGMYGIEMPSFETDKCNVADPGSETFLTPESAMGKNSRFGSGMNIPESLKTVYWVKNT
jgi:hypothetical protein